MLINFLRRLCGLPNPGRIHDLNYIYHVGQRLVGKSGVWYEGRLYNSAALQGFVGSYLMLGADPDRGEVLWLFDLETMRLVCTAEVCDD